MAFAIAPTLALALAVAGCADPAAAARESCDAQGVGERRCRALVAEGLAGLDPGRPPITGVTVHVATPADQTTLRAQQLVAVVRVSFLDGSAQEVQVFCQPRDAGSLACGQDAS